MIDTGCMDFETASTQCLESTGCRQAKMDNGIVSLIKDGTLIYVYIHAFGKTWTIIIIYDSILYMYSVFTFVRYKKHFSTSIYQFCLKTPLFFLPFCG